jgi:hypothetical protein
LRQDTGSQSEVSEVNQTQFKLYLENDNGKVTAGTRSCVGLSHELARHLDLDFEEARRAVAFFDELGNHKLIPSLVDRDGYA